MTKLEMRREIVTLLISKLRDGAFNSDTKGSLSSAQYEEFCQIELDVAERIAKTFRIDFQIQK